MTGTPTALEEVAGEDLHVAGEHDQVARRPREQLEQPRLGRRLLASGRPGRGRTGRPNASTSRRAGPGGWRRPCDDRPRRARRGASATAGRAGSGRSARRGSRCACGRAASQIRQSIPNWLGDRAAKRRLEARPRRASSVELHPHEEARRPPGRSSAGADCVMFAPRLAEERRDGGHDPRPVGAGDQQAHEAEVAATASVADGGGGELGDQLVLVEALERERLDQLRLAPGGDQLGERAADDRRGLEAVRAPARADVEVLDLGLAEDRRVVRAEVAEAGPRAQEPRVLELREQLERVAREVLQEVERARASGTSSTARSPSP